MTPATSPRRAIPWIDNALEYAGRRWYTVPLQNPTGNPERPCSCRKPLVRDPEHPEQKICEKPAKHPRTAHGSDDATCDPETLKAWHKEFPYANLAIVLAPSGLASIAPDCPEWKAAFEELGLPRTACFRSGGGEGHEHHLYRLPPGCPRYRLCKPDAYDILTNGYVVAPPSRHISGRDYEWIIPPEAVGELPELPGWAVAMVVEAAAQSEALPPAPSSATTTDQADEEGIDLEELPFWSGKEFKTKANGQVDRSRTLYAIGRELREEAGFSALQIEEHVARRDVALNYFKYAQRKGAGAERQYREIARKVVDRYSPKPREAQPVQTTKSPVNGDHPNTAEKIITPADATAEGEENPLEALLYDGPKLSRAVIPEPEWLVPGLIARGNLTMLAGLGKLGKSVLAHQLCVAGASGGVWLDQSVPVTRSLYVNWEDPLGLTRARAYQQFETENLPAEYMALDSPWGVVGSFNQFLGYLRRLIEAHRVGLVVIDPLALAAGWRDETDNAETGPTMRNLQEVARLTSAAILAVHHTRKAGGEYGVEVRGAGAIFNGLQGFLSFRREGKGVYGLDVLNKMPGEHGGERHLTLRRQPHTLTWHVTGVVEGDEDGETADDTEAARELVYAMIAANPWSTRERLAGLAKMSEASIRRHTKSLEDAGRIISHRVKEEGQRGPAPIVYNLAPAPAQRLGF